MNRWQLSVWACLMSGFALAAAEPGPTFDGQIKPILARHCLKCHSGDRPRGDLDLSTYSALMQGGVSGKAVVAGQAGESSLYMMTAHLEEPKMPPNSPKIPQSELDLLKRWIDAGALEKASTASSSTVPPAATTRQPSTTNTSPTQAGLMAPVPMPRLTAVTALASNGQLAAYPGFKQILLADLASQKLLRAFPFPEGEVHVLKFSSSGKTLLAAGGVGGQSGLVTAFDLTTGQRLGTVADSSDAILAADLSPDEKLVVYSGPSRIVKVADWPTGQVRHTFKKPTDWVLAAAFSPDGLLVAAADRFGGVNLWETRNGKEFLTLRAHTKAATALAWRGDSTVLATVGEDGSVRLWDLHTGQLAKEWLAHEPGILDVAWPSEARIMTAGRDRLVKAWNAEGKADAHYGPMADVILKLAAPAESSVIAGDWSGQVKLWSPQKPKGVALPLPVSAQPTSLALIPVPVPEVVPVATTASLPAATKSTSSTDDLKRKKETLAMLEASAERLKEEAARNPANASLKAAYLQVCEAVLAMKADVIATEAAGGKP